MSIRKKSLRFALFIIVIPIVTVVISSYFLGREIIRKQTLGWLEVVAEAKERHVQTLMKAKIATAIAFSSDGYIRDTLGEFLEYPYVGNGSLSKLIDHLSYNKLPLDQDLLGIYFSGCTDTIIGGTDNSFNGFSMKSSIDIEKVHRLDYGEAYVVSFPGLKVAGNYCMSIFTPVFETESPRDRLGMLICCFRYDFLNDITVGSIEQTRPGLGKTGKVYIVSSNGLMLTESRFIEGAELRQIVDTEPIRRSEKGEYNVVGIYTDYRGVLVLGSARSFHLREYGWTLLVEIDAYEAFSSVYHFQVIMAGISFFVLGIAFYVSWRFNNYLILPLVNLSTAMDEVSKGNMEQLVTVSGEEDSELRLLSASFNEMITEIKYFRERTKANSKSKEAELNVAEEQLRISLHEKETLLREVYHRTKNNMQIICSIIKMQSRRLARNHCDKAPGIFRDIENRIRALSLVHDELYKSKNLTDVNLALYLEKVGTNLMKGFESPEQKVLLDTGLRGVHVSMETAVPCGLLVNELMTNSLKYAFDKSSVNPTIYLRCDEIHDEIIITVGDNGKGLPEGTDLRKTKGLGYELVYLLGEKQLNGEVEVDLRRGIMVTFRFKELGRKKRV